MLPNLRSFTFGTSATCLCGLTLLSLVLSVQTARAQSSSSNPTLATPRTNNYLIENVVPDLPLESEPELYSALEVAEEEYSEPQYSEPQYAEPQYGEPQYSEEVMPAIDSATASDTFVEELPYASSPTFQQSQVFTSSQGPSEAATVIKNRNLFGVSKESCCDEWSGFCRFKNLDVNCPCGGLKANKGHLGVSWFRTADAGEDCDYCQGGCCERSRKEAGTQRRKTRKNVFADAWKKAFRGPCEDCNLATCPEEEGCESCR